MQMQEGSIKDCKSLLIDYIDNFRQIFAKLDNFNLENIHQCLIQLQKQDYQYLLSEHKSLHQNLTLKKELLAEFQKNPKENTIEIKLLYDRLNAFEDKVLGLFENLERIDREQKELQYSLQNCPKRAQENPLNNYQPQESYPNYEMEKEKMEIIGEKERQINFYIEKLRKNQEDLKKLNGLLQETKKRANFFNPQTNEIANLEEQIKGKLGMNEMYNKQIKTANIRKDEKFKNLEQKI